MNKRLILAAGFAASGKTFVARRLAERLAPCCYLDKDTLATPFVERLVAALGEGAGDRDSAAYQHEVRPLEYACLLAAGWEATDFAPYVVLCAPFQSQLVDRAWCDALRGEAARRGVSLRVVWIHCDQATLRARMASRGSPRDRAKLSDWDNYCAALDAITPGRFGLEHLAIDNSSEELLAAQFEALRSYVALGNNSGNNPGDGG